MDDSTNEFTDTRQKEETMDDKEIAERLHALEVGQATGAATLAGAQATQAAVQAGTATTGTAMAWGNMSTMIAGGVALVAGIFIGLAMRAKH